MPPRLVFESFDRGGDDRVHAARNFRMVKPQFHNIGYIAVSVVVRCFCTHDVNIVRLIDDDQYGSP